MGKKVNSQKKFNCNWKFKKGNLTGVQNINFDDSDWRLLDLPHDWSIEGDFSEKYASSTGYLPGGIGWYRKTFNLPQKYQEKKVTVQFDGIYKNSEVYVNGNFVGKRPYGYISFSYDITPYLYYGEKENVIAVKVDHSDFADSRWYTGSGIYRAVYLKIADKLHLKEYGTFVTTPEITQNMAGVRVQNYLENEHIQDMEIVLKNTIQDRAGEIVKDVETTEIIKNNSEKSFVYNMKLNNPELWSPESPYLYQLETQILNKEKDKLIENKIINFGIRYFKFDADQGFFLNGKNTKMKGVCLHHDAGCLGAAVPEKVWKRRLALLKEMGCNAIRMSHNPPDPVLLDLCDSMGFLVQDEAFDEWEFPKNKWVDGWNKGKPAHHGYAEDFAEWAQEDLHDMVLRDRNHPSIIFWSIGNEIDYPNDPYSHEVLGDDYNPDNPAAERMGDISRQLTNIVKKYDNSRPVTAALACVEMSNQTDFVNVLDVVGYNYQEDRYQKDKKQFPARIIYGSENKSSLEAWQAVEENDQIAAQFLWTGIDYLGESGSWPSRNSRAGLLDLAAFKKPEYFYRQSMWSEKPMINLFSLPMDKIKKNGSFSWELDVKPHWNWQEQAGEKIRVICCTNCAEVELFLNGNSLGERKLSNFKQRFYYWDIPYKEGILRATAKKNGKIICFHELKTAGKAEKLDVSSDTEIIKANNEDIAHIEVCITDKEGNLVYDAENEIYCEIKGPGKILGIENGSDKSHENYQKNNRKAFRGKLLVYVQAKEKSGEIELKLHSPDLSSEFIFLKAVK